MKGPQNKALQQTGGAWLLALGGPVVRASSLRRRPQLNAALCSRVVERALRTMLTLVVGLALTSCATRTNLADVPPALDQGTMSPQPLNVPLLRIPEELRGQRCVPGAAVVEGVVATDGRISRMRLLRSSGAQAYDVSCLSSAAQRAFKPASKNGRPVSANTVFTCVLDCR